MFWTSFFGRDFFSYFECVILRSRSNLAFIVSIHLLFILFDGISSPSIWITLSHLIFQIRCADSDINSLYSLLAPHFFFSFSFDVVLGLANIVPIVIASSYTSGSCPTSFQRFLNLKNLRKPGKTLETSGSGNLCQFFGKPPRNILCGNLWKSMKI